MENTIEFVYGQKNIYISNRREMENYIGFINFLKSNNIISNKPNYSSIYYSTDSSIKLDMYFADLAYLAKTLNNFSDLGFTPSNQFFLFKMLSLFIEVKLKERKDNYFRIFIRTYTKKS